MKRAVRVLRRVLPVLSVVIASAFGAAVLQYVAQHSPGTKAAYSVRQILVDFDLPGGSSYRLPKSHLERNRELERMYESPTRADGTVRPEYAALWDDELALYKQARQGSRLAAWRDHDSITGAYTDRIADRAYRHLIAPIDWFGVLASSVRHMARSPGDIPIYVGGGSTLSHPPMIGFNAYHDEDGVLAGGTCFLPDFSTPKNTLYTIGFVVPFYVTALTSLGPLWYAIYHVGFVLLVWGAFALVNRVRQRAGTPGRTTLARAMVLSSMVAIPLPALFEIIWKAWWVYSQVYDHRAGVYTGKGLVLTSTGLHLVWTGVAFLHALVVCSLMRREKSIEQSGRPTYQERLRSFITHRWWQLTMVATSVVLFGAPLLLGWYYRMWNEGVF